MIDKGLISALLFFLSISCAIIADVSSNELLLMRIIFAMIAFALFIGGGIVFFQKIFER